MKSSHPRIVSGRASATLLYAMTVLLAAVVFVGTAHAQVCGNGVTEGSEQCDDGNTYWRAGQSCNGACQLVECGDPNDDGSLAITDALFVLRVAGGDASCDLCVCDVDDDGDIDDDDATLVLSVVVGQTYDLTCPVCGPGTSSACGDDVTQMPGEQCDGTDDAACPELCLPPDDPNACRCPRCGDGSVNRPGEDCDRSDDAACPGQCASTCVCAVCGDDVADAPVETCDGADDAACPGQCAPPGDPSECECPTFCGDGIVNQPGEECDGYDDLACPGECAAPGASNECLCPACGDGILNQESEQCDPPGAETCNNLNDDDGDGLVDCQDTQDCPVGLPTCGASCEIVAACEPPTRDPGWIRFGNDGVLDRLTIHARFHPRSEVDPSGEGFAIEIHNADGVVYRGVVLPGDFQTRGARGRVFRFRDRTAKSGGGQRDGIAKLRVRRRSGNVSFRLTAYGDLSAATLAEMTTQFMIGNDGASSTAEWKAVKTGWRLKNFNFD